MGKEINVCLINDSFPPLIDGVANTVVNYANVINSGLGKASVVAPYYPDADDSAFNYPVLRMPSVDTTGLVGYRAGYPFDPNITRRLEDSNFDIIHSHCPITSTFLGRTLRDTVDIPIVLTYHTKFDIDIKNSIRIGMLQEPAIKALVSNVTACDEVWAVSHGAGENLKSLGYEGDYIVMPNGVDFAKGRVDENTIAKTCDKFDLPKDIPCYLFVGRIMWYKGIKIILDALCELKKSGKDFRMVFIGKGQDKNEVIKYSNELGLEDKVIFHNPICDRDELRAWFCRADLFLFPSTFDTNGLVVREAAACALGSVLVKGSCAAEDTKENENCYWIEESADSLYSLLIKKGFDLKELKCLGQRSQDQLYFSWEDSIKNAYERYSYVIEKYKTGAYFKERLERQKLLDMTSDALFKISSDSIQRFIDAERHADELILRTWSNLKEIKNDYYLIKSSLDEARSELVFDVNQVSNDIKNEIEKLFQ